MAILKGEEGSFFALPNLIHTHATKGASVTTNNELIDKNLTYFITTHSNHFLDLTIEKENVSIYSFNSLLLPNGSKKFQIKNVKFHVDNKFIYSIHYSSNN